MSSLEEKKHHEVKLREGLGDLSVKRMELQNALSSSWPKQVSEKFFSSAKLGTAEHLFGSCWGTVKNVIYIMNHAKIFAICL